MPVVDLRSDTLTVPTEAMRAAMREAEVGDDGRVDAEGRGGDPTVNRLEDHAAELLGKEAALFCPSGTMANLVALATWCDRGDAAALEPDLQNKSSQTAASSCGAYAQLRPPAACLQGPVRNILNAAELVKACNAEKKWHIE